MAVSSLDNTDLSVDLDNSGSNSVLRKNPDINDVGQFLK
jgi:hypothetical protein